jgi:hypothetical protein
MTTPCPLQIVMLGGGFTKGCACKPKQAKQQAETSKKNRGLKQEGGQSISLRKLRLVNKMSEDSTGFLKKNLFKGKKSKNSKIFSHSFSSLSCDEKMLLSSNLLPKMKIIFSAFSLLLQLK